MPSQPEQERPRRYPPAPAGSAAVTIGDLTFADPYQWLEEESAETLAWQAAENALAEDYIHGWSGFERLLAAVAAELIETEIDVPVMRGGLAFRLTREPAAEQRVLKVFEPGDATGRVVVDPHAGGKRQTIDWWYPSSTGQYVAYGLSERGNEQSTLHVVETARGETLPERLPFASHSVVAWLPDESGFYYSAGLVPDAVDNRKYIFYHRLGQPEAGEPEEVPAELTIHSQPQASRDGRYVAALVYPGVGTLRIAFVCDRQTNDGWRPFIPLSDEQCSGDFVGDNYVAISKDGAPRGRVVAIPVAGGMQSETWRELVPESEAVLQHLWVVGERLVLQELVEAAARIRVLTLDGAPFATVPLPDDGTVAMLQPDREAGALWFDFVSYTASPALYRYELATGELTQVSAPTRRLDGLTTRRVQATSRDGARVPALLTYKGDLDLSQPRPTIIYAYGGFNMVESPTWLGRWAPFIEAGGVYVHAHLRGGGQYGSEWWADGRLANKQHTFDDLYAVAEHLIAEGIASADRLATIGSSNGGLLAGVASTQRPDLFAAIVSQVPVLDVLRAWQVPYLGSAVRMEYGDPRDPEQARWLHAYSPYHNVREGQPATATLVACGASDMRCPPWQSGKFVARMQAAHPDALTLMRVWPDIGHGTGTTATTGALIAAEPLAFIMRQLEMEPA